jgi:adenylate kinase family enzyme
MFDRILIIGTTCSGKSTLSRQLATLLDSPVVELDQLFWKPNWQESSVEEFGLAIRAATKYSRWIVDGNYPKVIPFYWDRVETVIFVNTSLPKVLWRVVHRTCVRWWTDQSVCNGNHETPWRLLRSDSLLLYALRTNRRRYGDFSKRVQQAQQDGKRGYEIRSRADGERLLREVAAWRQSQVGRD